MTKREVEIALRYAPPLGRCSVCFGPALSVVSVGRPGGEKFYGICFDCVNRMHRIASAASRARKPNTKKGT